MSDVRGSSIYKSIGLEKLKSHKFPVSLRFVSPKRL